MLECSNCTLEERQASANQILFIGADGRESTVKMAFDLGANANAVDEYGKTPLYYAAKKGYESIVRLLLERGASTQGKPRNGIDDSALHAAADHGHEAIVRMLIESGADVDH